MDERRALIAKPAPERPGGLRLGRRRLAASMLLPSVDDEGGVIVRAKFARSRSAIVFRPSRKRRIVKRPNGGSIGLDRSQMPLDRGSLDLLIHRPGASRPIPPRLQRP